MLTSNAAIQPVDILADAKEIASPFLEGYLEERLSLFNRYFGGQRDETLDAADPVLLKMTQEFSEILGLLCEREHLQRAPLLLQQKNDAIKCRGHEENDAFTRLFNTVPGLATAFHNLAQNLYLTQSMLEYRIFLACYREIFAAQGHEAAANVSSHFEAMACPAPCLVFDGHEISVLFGGKTSLQRVRDLNTQLSLYANSERTIDRYFPTFLARHLPEGWVPPERGQRRMATDSANC